ncbi:12456_t:CDS:2, partial [Funneliformis geosporum]
RQGTIHGFIGPNGAGKTTTLKCLMDGIEPSSGEIYLDNQKIRQNELVNQKIGFMTERVRFSDNMSVENFIHLAGQLRNISASEIEKRLRKSDLNNHRYKNFLDEPTSGLDPSYRGILLKQLEHARQRGVTILISSHILSDLQKLVDEVTFIDKGKIVYTGDKPADIEEIYEKLILKEKMKQPDQFTVQGSIENILSKVFQQKINILAASRTDKGVHALDQKFTLRLNRFFPPSELFNLLKKVLRQYVLIKKVQTVDNNFHPIRNVVSKEYRYFIDTGEYNIFQKKSNFAKIPNSFSNSPPKQKNLPPPIPKPPPIPVPDDYIGQLLEKGYNDAGVTKTLSVTKEGEKIIGGKCDDLVVIVRKKSAKVSCLYANADGPFFGTSGGTAFYLALISAIHKKPLPNNLASTGEIKINEKKVSAIGGLPDKIDAAFEKRTEILVLPESNKNFFKFETKNKNKPPTDQPQPEKKATLHFVDNCQQLRDLVFQNKLN